MFNLFSKQSDTIIRTSRDIQPGIQLLNGGRPFTNDHSVNYCSGTHEWFSYDDKKTYEQNLKSKPADWYWRDRTITYKVNSQHYRCSEWDQIDWNNSILILGCSMVFGLGLDEEQTISAQLSHRLNTSVVNLGVPGISAMFQWINTTRLVEQSITPLRVVYIWPHYFRVADIVDQTNHIVCGRWNFKTNDLSNSWSDRENHSLEFLRTCIESTKQQWSCPTHHYTFCLRTSEYLPDIHRFRFDEYIDYSRDTQHPGPKTIEQWADKIANDIQSE